MTEALVVGRQQPAENAVRTATADECRALQEAREQTDKLFTLVYREYLYDRPVPERHRLIFYLGHVDAFDWNHIARWNLDERSFDPSFDKLFEAGIDPPPGQLPTDTGSDWPAVEQVRDYIRRVRSRLDDIARYASSDIINMAIEHRLMHAETLSYLIHNLPYRHKLPVPTAPYPRVAPVAQRMIAIPEGDATLGANREAGFGWDNEFDGRRVRVPAFAIQRRKVTNGEYLRFVEQGAAPPHYWTKVDGKWYFRGMFGLVRLPLDAPVYVTHRQAVAYCAEQGKKLPTEPQFQRAAYGTRYGERLYPWGNAEPTRAHGNFNFCHWNPVPCDANPAGESWFGVAQTVGNGWEWTSTVFAPFEGFEPAPNYPGYSANFFDGEHYVLKGASPRTAARLLRRSFRNWFRPDYPHVYATFRCVED